MAAASPQIATLVPKWKQRTADTHKKHVTMASNGKFSTLFLGDSMFERWMSTGRNFWFADLSKQNIFNAGVGGDKIENLLWRLTPSDGTQGILDVMKPSRIVLMIGTNNIETDKIENILDGYQNLLNTIIAMQEKQNNKCHIVIYALLPRKDVSLSKVKYVNLLIESLVKSTTIELLTKSLYTETLTPLVTLEYRNMNALFEGKEVYDDNVHLNSAGYQIWLEDLKTCVN